MSALLGIDIEGAEAAVKEATAQGGVCVVANDNAPGQVVISGTAMPWRAPARLQKPKAQNGPCRSRSVRRFIVR